MEDSLFGKDPVDEWTMHQLRQILDQQRKLMEQLNVPPLPAFQLAQDNVPKTCAHVDISGEGLRGSEEAKESRQPRRHTAVFPAEEKQKSPVSATIQPVANKNLDQHTLPPSKIISGKMAERSSIILSTISPQQLQTITDTHTPGNPSSPEDQQQSVSNMVGTLSGSRHTDDILVGAQSKVHHAVVVRPGRHVNAGIVKHFLWKPSAKRVKGSVPVLFRQFNKDVHPGRPIKESDRSGSRSKKTAEWFTLTGQQLLKTKTGGKTLRSTINDQLVRSRKTFLIEASKTKAALLLMSSSLFIKHNKKQHNTRARSCNEVHLHVDWPWDPGEQLKRVSPVWPSNNQISTNSTVQDRTRQRIVEFKNWPSTTSSFSGTLRGSVCNPVYQINNSSWPAEENEGRMDVSRRGILSSNNAIDFGCEVLVLEKRFGRGRQGWFPRMALVHYGLNFL